MESNGAKLRGQPVGLAKEVTRGLPASPPKSLVPERALSLSALQEPTEGDLSSASLASCGNLKGDALRRGAGSRELFAINQLRAQLEGQRRRMAQLERRLELQLEERLAKGERDRWAETQGTVTGLLEDVQSLRQRLDGLDQRRHEPKDMEKRVNELQAQIQTLEHNGRMSQASLEEYQRRQVARQRRWDQNLEELHTRVAQAAGEAHSRGRSQPDFEPRVRQLEHRQEYLETGLASLQMQVEDGLQAVNMAGDGDESVSQRGLITLERKTSHQIQDLSSAVASLRVRLDGQLQRMSSLSERMEARGGELVVQDHSRHESELAVLRQKMQDFAERCDADVAELHEVVRRTAVELQALQHLPAQLQQLQEEVAVSHVPEPLQLVPMDDLAEASESSEDWPLEAEQLESREETATELHALAGHLLAADALAARVVELERFGGEADAETLSPFQVKLYRLSNEVGELQARLLSTRLQRELEAEAVLEDPEGPLDLANQEQELIALERQVSELEQAFLPERAAEDPVRGPEDTDFADLADRLEPLERALRLVAERLNGLSPQGLLPSLLGGEGLEALGQVDGLKLSPELEEKLRQVDEDAKVAAFQVDVQRLAQTVVQHDEDLASVKQQTQDVVQDVEILRGEMHELQGLLRKEPSGVSPLTKARGKLDLLCAEMAELQSQMREAGPGREKFQDRWSEDEVGGPGPRSAGLGASPLRQL